MLTSQSVQVSGVASRPGRTNDEATVGVQYTDHNNEPCELVLPLKNAMYLLAMLDAVRRDLGFEMPRDPNTLAPS